MLDAPNTARGFGPRDTGDGGRGRPAVAHPTTSQIPSSIAAAARHAMPTADAPPRSVRSAKFTDQPQYSAMVAGRKSEASATSPAHTRPSTSAGSMPASARAAAASPAPTSLVSEGGPLNFPSDGRPAVPTMDASPPPPLPAP